MNKGILGAAAVGAAAVGTACVAGAYKLFNTVIPRQDVLRVDISEMADAAKWEEYKKIITPTREWLEAQPIEKIKIKTYDGITLNGNFLHAEQPSKKIAICGHGYTGTSMKDCACISAYLHKLGYNCLLVDHRAHGESEGDYVGFGILDRFDWRAWIKYLETRFGEDIEIVLYGVSMGATIAIMTAGLPNLSKTVKAVVADCAFTSPYDVFAHILKKDYHLPPFPVMNINDQLCRVKAGYGFKDYSTIDAVHTTKVPILFIHGRDDNFVPLWMCEENYKECRSPKELMIVDNAGHAASYYQDKDAYEEKVSTFLEKYVHSNSEAL